jgi:hypothetical protein
MPSFTSNLIYFIKNENDILSRLTRTKQNKNLEYFQKGLSHQVLRERFGSDAQLTVSRSLD